MQDGSTSQDSLAVANAHPMGARPFGRADYIRKFQILTEGIPAARDAIRFPDAVRDLPKLPAGALHQLDVDLPNGMLETGQKGILSLLILGGHDDE
jgi:2-methylcitrate dehydratase